MFNRKKKTYRNLEDVDLLLQFSEETSSLIIGELYLRYAHLVMGTAMKYLKNKHNAEDLTMNLFEKLPKKISSSKIEHFKSWLYMVTKNECLMLLRKKKVKNISITQEIEAKYEIADVLLKEQKLDQLEFAIENLKEQQKICIQLFYIESKSYLEISTQLNLDQKKVKSAIQNGKRNLKINLEEKNEFRS